MKKQVSLTYMVAGLLFTVCLIVANITAQKTITIFGLSATAAILVFPVSYIVNDLIAEVWGYKKARFIIWIGFLLNFLVVIIFRLSILIPENAFFPHQGAFAQILGSTFRLTVASFAAFLLGSFVNAYVMSKMKILQKGKRFSIRAVVSTFAGEGMDSLVFFFIAFVGIMPLKNVFELTLHIALLKTVYEVLVLPLTIYLVKRIKKVEGVDVYDQDVNYNPFKINEF
ncbi:MAG: queuosine precursor transporter [Paludibacter sp.]|nr:queuosine precursor transporter [Paludibacter sp.]MDD4197837.1 queuosine precursor transporter [Paludibacter sp.]MDD4427880.1 queuosine precursor transporter [Paludibacter sp.]